MKNTDKEDLIAAMDAAILALDDWSALTAPEFCDEARVEEANKRVDNCGYLWYIATTVNNLRDAKELLK